MEEEDPRPITFWQALAKTPEIIFVFFPVWIGFIFIGLGVSCTNNIDNIRINNSFCSDTLSFCQRVCKDDNEDIVCTSLCPLSVPANNVTHIEVCPTFLKDSRFCRMLDNCDTCKAVRDGKLRSACDTAKPACFEFLMVAAVFLGIGGLLILGGWWMVKDYQKKTNAKIANATRRDEQQDVQVAVVEYSSDSSD